MELMPFCPITLIVSFRAYNGKRDILVVRSSSCCGTKENRTTRF